MGWKYNLHGHDWPYLATVVDLGNRRVVGQQKSYMKFEDKQEKAVVFYVLNRSSFSGTTLSGGMSLGHKRFNQSAIERVRNFKVNNLHIKQDDF